MYSIVGWLAGRRRSLRRYGTNMYPLPPSEECLEPSGKTQKESPSLHLQPALLHWLALALCWAHFSSPRQGGKTQLGQKPKEIQ